MKATKFQKAVSYFALASVFSMAGCQKDQNAEEPAPELNAAEEASKTGKVIEGQYIVVFKNNGDDASEILNKLVAAKKLNSGDIKDKLEGKINGFTGKLTKKQYADLLTNSDVQAIEQDQVITAQSTSSTTVSLTTQAVQWGVSMVGYGDGTGKTAWVIDSGVSTSHPDLNVDVSRSVNFNPNVSGVEDGYGHGTMVAGIIGAKNNSIGVVGVAANASIVALRVLDNSGAGSLSYLIKAVSHVNTYGKAGDVVNISLAAGASSTLDYYIQQGAAKGIFFAIAAGNSSVDCSNNSPQRVNANNVYTVSAMDQNKYFFVSSNYGAPVDRAAPGVNITTTGLNGTYTYGHGTSFAAPHVAGLLLLKGNYIGTNGQVIGDKDSWADPIARL
jgi:subtilisin family serine protease